MFVCLKRELLPAEGGAPEGHSIEVGLFPS